MNNRILAVDLGYSNVKISYYDENGTLQLHKILSSCAKIPDPLEADDVEMFRFLDSYYVVGSNALKVPRRYLMEMESYEGLEEAYPVIMSYVLKMFGGAERFDRVVIGLSLAFQDKREQLKKKLNDTLQLENQGLKVDVLLQGLSIRSAYEAHGLYLTDDTKTTQSRLQNYLILDVGFNTTDVTAITGGKSASGSVLGLKMTGIIRIASDIQKYLQDERNMTTSIREAMNILDNGGIFNRRGRRIDISDKVKEFTRKYIAFLMDLLDSRFAEDLDLSDGVILVGGGALVLQKLLDENDQETIDTIEEHFPLNFMKIAKKDAEFYNSVSYLEATVEKLKAEEAQN